MHSANELAIYVLHDSKLVEPHGTCIYDPYIVVSETFSHILDVINAYNHGDKTKENETNSNCCSLYRSFEIIEHHGHRTDDTVGLNQD